MRVEIAGGGGERTGGRCLEVTGVFISYDDEHRYICRSNHLVLYFYYV